jgi:hypothetical protein
VSTAAVVSVLCSSARFPVQRSRESAQTGWEEMEKREDKWATSRTIRRGQKR